MAILSVQEIEQICSQFFAGLTPSNHVQTTNYQLESFLNDPECPASSLLLIERATSQYSVYFGALGLARSYMKPNLSLNRQVILQHKTELLNYVLEKPLTITVLTSLCKAYACLIKRFWFMKVNKQYVMQDVLRNCTNFNDKSEAHRLTLVVLLTNVVNVILAVSKNDSYIIQSLHQRVSINFKRNHLVHIFALSVRILRQFAEDIKSISSFGANQNEMLERSLALCKECFAVESHEGSLSDEVSESLNMCANSIEWNDAFSTKSVEAFFKLITDCKIEIGCECLSILANFSTIRCSRIDSKDRSIMLKSFMENIFAIIKNQSIKLCNQQFYYNFFRLITLIKSNNRVRELEPLINFDEFLDVLKELTLSGIKTMQSSSNNLLYTINAWKPIVSSQLYSRINSGNSNLKLSKHVLKILEAFINERLLFFEQVVKKGAEDPLEDSSSLSQMLDVVSTLSDICSFEFGTFVLACFDPILEQLQSMSKAILSNELKLIEVRLAWLVHVLACVTNGSSDGPKIIRKVHSAASIFRILKLSAYLKDVSSSRTFEKLELSIIDFLARFENTYLQALSPQAARLYRELNELCGISNERDLMRIVLNKIAFNLTQFSKSYSLINATLTLLNDLIVDTSHSKLITSLDESLEFIKNCSNRDFPLLRISVDQPDSLKIMKCRSKLFTAIGHMCKQRLEETRGETEFISFLRPFIDTVDVIKKSLSNREDSSKQTQFVLIGLVRDLRGFCSSQTSYESFGHFFQSIHGENLQVLSTALERFYNVPEVTSAILRFFDELCTDRETRFNFPVFSPDGINLVRLVTRAIYSFASNLLNLSVPAEQLYPVKLKPISICFHIMHLIISQAIVNLGVFNVYSDHSVGNVLEVLAALCLGIQPDNELAIYPKLVGNYFKLMQELAIAKIDFFTSLSPQVFSYVIVTIRMGLNMPDSNVIMRSCSVLFAILMYMFDCVNKRKHVTDTERLLDLVRQNMSVFNQIMEIILNIAIYEQNFKLNFVSDCFLLLILLNHEGFNQLYERFVTSMNLDEDSATALQLFAEFSTASIELVPLSSSSTFLRLLLSLRRELSNLMNTPIDESSSDMVV